MQLSFLRRLPFSSFLFLQLTLGYVINDLKIRMPPPDPSRPERGPKPARIPGLKSGGVIWDSHTGNDVTTETDKKRVAQRLAVGARVARNRAQRAANANTRQSSQRYVEIASSNPQAEIPQVHARYQNQFVGGPSNPQQPLYYSSGDQPHDLARSDAGSYDYSAGLTDEEWNEIIRKWDESNPELAAFFDAQYLSIMSADATQQSVALSNAQTSMYQDSSGYTYTDSSSFNHAPNQFPQRQPPNGPPIYYNNDGTIYDPRNYWPPQQQHGPSNQYYKRASVLTGIESAVTTSSSSPSSDFDLELEMLYSLQNNISISLTPLFDVVLNNTNSSLIYNLVWSVYSDLTGIGPKIIGPYSFGFHCFDWIEDVYLNSTRNNTLVSKQNQTTNLTSTSATRSNSTDKTYQMMLATHYTLIELYNFTWTHGVALANQTGNLDLLYGLTLSMASMNVSGGDSTWTGPPPYFDDSYFTQYNQTGAS